MSPRQYLHTAYLLSRYPAVSHTFFLNEIAGLNKHDLLVETASINAPDRPIAVLPEEEQRAFATTFYIKQQSYSSILSILLLTTLRRPKVIIRALSAAFRLEPGHFTHTAYALFYVVEAIILGDWMRRRGLTHLHVHFAGPVASVGMIAALAWHFPFSLSIHGPDEFFDQREMALAQKIHAASFIVCISEFCRSQIMRITAPADWDKYHIVRLGISPALADLQPMLRDPGTPMRILCTGRLVGAKGQAVLLLSMAKLKQRNHAIEVIFIGDGPDRRHLEELVNELELRHAVTFLGSQNHDQVLETLRAVDLFVLPSFAEGVPVALMEAMAVGVPCISTFVGGIPELIRHEQDGLLVPAGSETELTNAIERLVTDTSARSRFRISARERVLTHYNLPKNLKLLADVFKAHLPQASSVSVPAE